MKHEITKKVMSLLLSVAMVFTFFPAQAFAESASTPQDIADAIKERGFSANVSGSTIIVTDTVYSDAPMTIDIPAGVTVNWGAFFSGTGGLNSSGITNGRSSLLNLTGNGNFVLNSSGNIKCTSSSTTTAIEALGPFLNIRGQVSSANGPAIFASSTKVINVGGQGFVQSQNMNAICASEDGTEVTVTGGSVLSGDSNFPAITFSGSSGSMDVIITGGSVQGVNSSIQPTDSDSSTSTPVYLVPVKVTNAEDTCGITAYLSKGGISVTYIAQTDADGNAYLWLPAGTGTIIAETESKSGSTPVTVASGTNNTANITVTDPVEDVAAAITDYNMDNGGGTGALTAEINGSTVTVTGSLTEVTKTLQLDVPQDVKVLWKAKLTGTGNASGAQPSSHLLEIDNSGTVEIAEGGEIVNSASAAAVVSSDGNLIMSGGKVTSTGSPGIAISAVSGCKFRMTGGEVTANQADSRAIYGDSGEGSVVTIVLTGGTVSASGVNGKQLVFGGTFVTYRSGMIQPGSIQCLGSQLSAAICVDQALTSTAPGMATGLALTAYNLPDGDSLTLQWVPKPEGIGINIVQQSNSNVRFIVFPGVNLVLPGSTHAITYNANGGSGTMNSTDVDDKADYTVAANSFTHNGYKFSGWNTQADGSGTAYLAGATITGVQNDITLFAQWSYIGSKDSGTTKPESATPAGGAAVVKNGIVTTVSGTFVTDTTTDVHVRGDYTVKLTNDKGQKPNVFVGTPGVFEVKLTTINGKDYFVKLISVGQPGAQAGVYLDGVKLFVATVETHVSSAVKSDTTQPFHVKSNASYVMKLTASARPALVSGTVGVFKIEFVKASGNDYLFRITPIGKPGIASGFYVNSEKSPVTIATIQ